jgi:phosphoenolpyruvate---glycerone phosphotransferase subunit DhaL
MSVEAIAPHELREILTFVTERIKAEEARLTALDSAIGDGDHGITMRIGFQAVSKRLGSLDESSGIGNILSEAGRAFMGATGGAIGVLIGKMLMSSGTALRDCATIGREEFKTLLDSMETAAAKAGKTQPGDKTILDAVHGACQAIAGSNASLQAVALEAASGAEAAAQSTANMLCRVGRASRLGERVLGCPDPGAVSFSVILRAISDWIEKQSSHTGSSVKTVSPEV